MSVKLLTEHHLKFLSLKEGYRGSFESTLVKMPHCWKSHALAHLFCFFFEWPRKTGITVVQFTNIPFQNFSTFTICETFEKHLPQQYMTRLKYPFVD